MSTEQDWRARTRQSRLGSFLVITITALGVALGAWYLHGGVTQKTVSDETTTGAVTQIDTGANTAPEIGKPIPNFTATDINGKEIALADLKGRPIWLSVVATWCQGCRAEMPDVQAAAQKYGDKLTVVSVFVGENTKTVKDFADRTKLSFTMIPDPDSAISSAYGTMGIPSHFFVDSQGILKEHAVGVISESQIEKHLATLK